VCLSRRIAARLELPSDWGVETAMMADAFRLCDPRRICQVDIAESHNHRHQSLSEKNPSAGLNKMGADIALCLLRTAARGPQKPAAANIGKLLREFRREALRLLDSYSADARMNLLEYDRALELRTVDLFARCIRRAAREYLASPGTPAGTPAWSEIFKRFPKIKQALQDSAKP
jgi:glucosyl-3-phosphoglycerate synthase